MMVAMLAEIFILRLETTARLMKDALPAGTLCFVAFSPEPQFSPRKSAAGRQKMEERK
jgi:hypothetical protein